MVMNEIKDAIENTLVIEKSIFITNIYPVENVSEINEIYKTIVKKYYDATHNCYAYIIDEGRIQKCSDDGEPAKTAGAPMLEVLKKQELTNVLAITTRYFGGIKLGASGLVRAYSNSVSEALKKAVRLKAELKEIYSLTINYSVYNNILNNLAFLDILYSSFTENVNLIIAIKKDEVFQALEKIKNLTNGKASIEYLREERTLCLA